MKRTSTTINVFVTKFNWGEYIDKLIVTYTQMGHIVLEKTENDVTFNGNILTVELSGNETKIFQEGDVEIEIKGLTKDGKNINSDKIINNVEDVLNDKVLV